MSLRTTRWLFVCGILAVLAAPLGLLTVFELLPSRADRAASWALSLTESEREDAVTSLDRLSTEERQQLVLHFTDEQKSAFWQRRLASYLAASHDLTPLAQRAIEDAQTMLTPAFFADPKAAKAQNTEILATLRNELGQDAYRDLVFLGRPSQLTMIERTAQWLKARVVAQAAPRPECECVPEEDGGLDCPFSSLECHANPADNCNPVPSGCWVGWLSWYDCIGLCTAPGGEEGVPQNR